MQVSRPFKTHLQVEDYNNNQALPSATSFTERHEVNNNYTTANHLIVYNACMHMYVRATETQRHKEAKARISFTIVESNRKAQSI